jgi:oxygen-dependent protoporphyrinogen oxidase
MTAAIIGAGIAGLTAAYELVKAGERPFVIEPGAVGGMLRSKQHHGFTLECGPNVIVERPEMTELLHELGLYDSVCHPAVNPYGQYVWYRNRAVKVPAGPGGLVTSPLFSLGAKVMLPLKLFVPGILPRVQADYSIADFLAPLIGRHATAHLLDPVLKGIYGGSVEELSARSIFPGLWVAAQEGRSIFGYMTNRPTRGKPPIMVLRGGIQRLAESLWEKVSPHVQHIRDRAERISSIDGKRYRISLADGRQIEVDGCIITSAGKSAAHLTNHLSEKLSERLMAMRYASLTAVHLSVPRSEPLIPEAFGVLFPGGMPLDLLGVMFNSLIFPHVAPPDRHVLTVMLGGAQAGDRQHGEDEVRSELPKLLRSLLGVKNVEWLTMVHWNAAIPQLTKGHYQLVESFDACEHEFPGVVFASVDRGGVGVSDRIRISREAVKRFRKVRVETVV